MIHILIDNGRIEEFEVKGTLIDIGAEVCCAINAIFNAFRQEDKELGNMFKHGIKEEVKKDLLWEEHDNENIKNRDDGTYNEAIKMIRSIIAETDEKGEDNNG